MQNIQEKNPASISGFIPMHLAAGQGHIETFQIFIENTQDKNPADDMVGVTPLHLEAREGHLEICKIIVQNITDICPESLEGVGYHLGTTPLHCAAQNGQFETFNTSWKWLKGSMWTPILQMEEGTHLCIWPLKRVTLTLPDISSKMWSTYIQEMKTESPHLTL